MRPNILFLVLDCVRYDGLHVLGNPRPVTPTLDALAARSRRYTQARSAAIWTLPSHASMFTGLYPGQHGVNVETRWLDENIPTLAQMLTTAGYQTVAFSTNAWVGPHFGLDRGFEDFYALWRLFPSMGKAPFPWWEKALRKKVLERGDKGARKLNRYVRRWWQQKRDPHRPFFLFGLYLDAHLPYRPPEAYARQWLSAEQWHRAQRVNQDAWAYMADEVTMTPQDFADLRALYDAEIGYVDAMLAELLDFLDSQGALENTLILITADHGENIGDHGLMDHQYCVCETLAHVPLLIHYPAAFPPGRDASPIQHTDLLPTLLELAEVAIPGHLPGHSLLHALPPARPQIVQYTAAHRHRFARRHPRFDPASKGYHRTYDAILQDGFKLVRSHTGEVWLYDLTQDPDESHNLAQARPDRVTALAAALTSWLESHPPVAAPGPGPELDEDLQKHLRGLGYL